MSDPGSPQRGLLFHSEPVPPLARRAQAIARGRARFQGRLATDPDSPLLIVMATEARLWTFNDDGTFYVDVDWDQVTEARREARDRWALAPASTRWRTFRQLTIWLVVADLRQWEDLLKRKVPGYLRQAVPGALGG